MGSGAAVVFAVVDEVVFYKMMSASVGYKIVIRKTHAALNNNQTWESEKEDGHTEEEVLLVKVEEEEEGSKVTVFCTVLVSVLIPWVPKLVKIYVPPMSYEGTLTT